MRIAILSCNDFSVIGGAERHILDLARALNADIICPGCNEDVVSTYDVKREAKIISLNKKLPLQPLKQIIGMRFYRKLKLNYDFYVSTDEMSIYYLKHDVPHLYYMFTPMRAMYDIYYCFLNNHRWFKKLFYSIGLSIFRVYDRHFVKKYIKNIACNSHNVRNRIYKIYQRDAEVIYPPIHRGLFKYKPAENYWLSVGRVDKWKRIELQVEAFRKLKNKKLYIVGKVYPQYEKLMRNAPNNVKFLRNVNEKKLIELYSRCEGFITTAIDEDFGLTPVEAMASGKPVVATKEGGYLETVVDGHTGLLVSPNVDEICEAINTISKNPSRYKEECIERAKMFDYQTFKKKIIRKVEECYAQR